VKVRLRGNQKSASIVAIMVQITAIDTHLSIAFSPKKVCPILAAVTR
jgi:hypothetical protein